ncbi:cyclic peptide export ABC transporter [Nitrospirillum amazonense]|uniref:cyclic peptide export ABC transporter n=1 Tax=Nitrospirillum amazonense TaxID=28077 RepID=UPI0024128B32|nr:cyclic peptide export ABC transporter [Nitrospirillum amazonense]MDG3442753.1 cyclic peptide export ABC transporter [Nitrospirillum amazonense]
MNLLRLIKLIGPARIRRLLLAAAGSALSSTLILVIVNAAASEIAEQQRAGVNFVLAGAFLASLAAYMATEGWMVTQMAAYLEEVVDTVRMRLVDQVRRSDLLKLERFGQARLFESVTQAGQLISQNSEFMAITLRSVLSVIAVLVYMAVLSPLAFLVISAVLAGGAWFYVRLSRALEEQQVLLMAEEEALFESVSDLFDGFKEQRLSSARSDDLNRIFVTTSDRTMAQRGRVHMHTWQQFIFGEMVFNLMLGILVFVLPHYSSSFSQQMVKVAAAVIFLSTPIFGLMQSLAVMTAADGAAGRMLDLGKDLAALAEPGQDAPSLDLPADFREIRLDGVEFTFPAPAGEPAFAVGPFDLTLRRGEVVFITGGNGSGKSTFIKLLTGLYQPMRGRLMVDDLAIGPQRLDPYREQMATVFADFHLFARLYGVPALDTAEVDELMRWMEMQRVTRVDGDRFARRDLSAGQRKRLGLVAALLEHKPVLILDEWAADQDPHFRRKFYREVVPALKERGLTLIAVTHDDQYFDVADRRLHMEEGRLREVPLDTAWHGREVPA